MCNSIEKQFIPQLERMAQDGDGVVAEHARWALKQLQSE
jgi:epoxyqueuosine reductase QueG